MREARGKRSLRIGSLTPNIVLYNDPTPHPSTATTSKVISADLARKPDLLLIFGTSLKVHGIKKLVKDFAKTIRANKGIVIFINKVELAKTEWKNVIDYWVEGDCDLWIHDLKSRIPELWMRQEVLPVLPVIKPTPKKSPSKGCLHLLLALTIGPGVFAGDEEKENYSASSTPTRRAALRNQSTDKIRTSPLSSSKRSVNVDAFESPTKRLNIGKLSVKDAPPPPMNWSAGRD